MVAGLMSQFCPSKWRLFTPRALPTPEHLFLLGDLGQVLDASVASTVIGEILPPIS